jgi:primosomal protein N' (replication factor Y)
VRVVGVISADTALNMPDFRSSERTFQLVCQVAGRSGRGEAAGRVFVQSFEPTNPAIVLAAGHDYERFAAQEIEHRRSNGLPPIARMARVVVRDEDLSKAQEQAGRLAEVIRKAAEEVVGAAGARSGAGAAGAGVSGAGIPGVAMPGGVRVVGPMEAPIARIGDYHRQQIELIADHAGWVQMVLGRVRQQGLITSDFHTAVDVDPTSLL